MTADKKTLTFRQKTVRLVVHSGPANDMLSYRIAGLRNPTIVVPTGAMIKALYINTDDDMTHNLRFGMQHVASAPSVGTPGLAHKTATAFLEGLAGSGWIEYRSAYGFVRMTKGLAFDGSISSSSSPLTARPWTSLCGGEGTLWLPGRKYKQEFSRSTSSSVIQIDAIFVGEHFQYALSRCQLLGPPSLAGL